MESICKTQLIDGESDSGSTNKEPVNIVNFCDDLIINIFSFLSHDDLVKMDSVCTTFSRISKDWTLWKYVNFNMYNRSMEEIYLRYLNNRTLHLSIHGREVPDLNSSITSGFIHQLGIKCPNITRLSLSYQIFEAVQRNHRLCFPKLMSFNIDHSIFETVEYDYNIFKNILLNCPNIEDVHFDTTYTGWSMNDRLEINIDYFKSLSNLKNLKYLSLQHMQLVINFLQLNTVIDDGFSKLQTLDLRFTGINNYGLFCFQKLKSLKTIFLQNPDTNDNLRPIITNDGLSFLTINDYIVEYQPIHRYYHLYNGNRCKIEHLYVRNYPSVTNEFLKNSVPLCHSLKTLDVTGTSCTIDGVVQCQTQFPHIKIIF